MSNPFAIESLASRIANFNAGMAKQAPPAVIERLGKEIDGVVRVGTHSGNVHHRA
jgi:hypothetical protein